MKTSRLKALTTEELIEKARVASAERWPAISSGRIKQANQMLGLLVAISEELRARGLEAQRQVLGLLDESEPGTRYWVASFALEFAPVEGERVLAELAKIPNSLIGFTAEVTLEQWKAGTFKPAEEENR